SVARSPCATSPQSITPQMRPFATNTFLECKSAFTRCASALAERGRALEDRLLRLWQTALETPVDVPAAWIHGDLHSRNVLVANGRICGVIDWGDVAQGDRATDLAATWILLSHADSREQVISGCRSVSANTW